MHASAPYQETIQPVVEIGICNVAVQQADWVQTVGKGLEVGMERRDFIRLHFALVFSTNYYKPRIIRDHQQGP